MKLYKRYIPVVVYTDQDGHLTPMSIVWEDKSVKTVYKIDRITDKRNAYSVVGGCGLLYECMIQGKKRNLFYEKNKWFIESLKP